MRYQGLGTEKLEQEIQERFPGYVVRRMDSDTMKKPGSHARVLGAFRAGLIHILLGTQMIAKGLDFPNVTLVGVVNADIGLHFPDFRAAERTFQLLAQVAGRTGRGDERRQGAGADVHAGPPRHRPGRRARLRRLRGRRAGAPQGAQLSALSAPGPGHRARPGTTRRRGVCRADGRRVSTPR